MLPFTFHAPTRITFGEGTAGSVAEAVNDLGGSKVFVVTDANLVKAGLLDALLQGLKDGSLAEPVVFDQVPPDSDVACVRSAARLACDSGCDCIVAAGGGSVIDTAKVVNIILSYGGDMLDYQGLNNLPRRLKPLICLPTTAGTGSEVSLVAMIKDHKEGKKLLFGSRFLAPDAAVLDPTLLVSLPPKLTAGTGADALTHCIEALAAVSTASPLSDCLALQAASMLFTHLERATVAGEDLKARSATLVASTMAGLAFTNAGVGLVHALAHTVGACFGTHHGMTNAVFLPYGMEFNSSEIADRYAYISRNLGINKLSNDRQAAGNLIAAVTRLFEKCSLPLRLRDLGVPQMTESKLHELADQAITDPAIMFNPKEASVEDIVGILKRAF